MKWRGQAALEFLATYGWALFVVILVAAAIWYSGAFDPSKWGEKKQVSFDVLTALDYRGETTGNLTISFGNDLSRTITLTGVGEVNGVQKSIVPLSGSMMALGPGGRGTFVVLNALPAGAGGSEYSIENVAIEYVDATSGLARKAQGFVKGKYENATNATTAPVTLFQWLNQTHFDAGTYTATYWDSVNAVRLSSTTNGAWTSEVRDALANVQWATISSGEGQVYGESVPVEAATVAQWSLDERGCTLADNSSLPNTATLGPSCPTNNATAVSARVNNGLSFDGVNDFINVTHNGSLSLVYNWTFEAWVRRTGSGVNEQRIWGRPSASDNNAWWMKGFSDNTVHVLIAGVGELSGTTALPAAWTHVALTVSRWKIGGTTYGAATLYINGVADGSISGPGTQIDTGSLPVYIGRAPPGGTGNYWQGWMDEIVFINRTLSVQEIQAHYNRTSLDLRFQARSCNDAACSGESFAGPDGTAASFYTQAAGETLNLPNNQYVQIRANFTSTQSTLSPRLFNATVNAQGT